MLEIVPAIAKTIHRRKWVQAATRAANAAVGGGITALAPRALVMLLFGNLGNCTTL